MQTLFKNLANRFLVESTKIGNTNFHRELASPKPKSRQIEWGVQH